MLVIDTTHRIVFSMSAKAGSMALVEMLYAHSGDLEHWPGRGEIGIHEFGRATNRRHGINQRKIAALLATPGRSGHLAFKFVRNPFTRAVSSYLHVVSHPQRLFAPFRPAAETPEGLSFRGFLEHLRSVDMWTCNTHYRIQKLPFEDQMDPPWDRIARIETLDADLQVVNREFGLSLTMPEERPARRRSLRAVGPATAVADVPFGEMSGGWPPYDLFYDERTDALVRTVYGADVDAYGYAGVDG